MLQKLIICGLLILAFIGGYMLASKGQEVIDSLGVELASTQSERDIARDRIAQLEQTLSLVKRQLQTDRIAYDKLQKSVDTSEKQRLVTEQKLAAQRALLDRLKQKIDNQ